MTASARAPDDRRPVLVGVAQLLQRVDDLEDAKTPLELMIDAVRAAAADAEATGILDRIDSIRVVKGLWGYRNPARAIAEALGLSRVETGLSVLGGNHVQAMLNQSAAEIQAGRREVVVLAGAECGRTMGRAQKAGAPLPWLEEPNDAEPPPDVEYGDPKWTRHEAEMARGIERPVQYYSLFELALRHRNEEAPRAHLQRVARLWARFSEVAQANPNAWIRRPVSAEEIATPSDSNRPITFPYLKLMNANMRVDMAAALVLCSEGAARRLGAPAARRVYPISGTEAYDHYFVSERDDLCSSPAIRIAGRRALEIAGLNVDELDLVDLYSCFPSAVQIAARELGLSLERALTVTGGLTFGGGPLNNYVMHAVARTVELLREGSGERALVTANGGMLTKHAFGVYGVEPGDGFQSENLQAQVDATPRRELAAEAAGEAEIESYVVAFGSRGRPRAEKSYTAIYGRSMPAGSEPTLAHLACLLSDGRRTWANLRDRDVLEAMCAEDFCGRRVVLDGVGAARMA